MAHDNTHRRLEKGACSDPHHEDRKGRHTELLEVECKLLREILDNWRLSSLVENYEEPGGDLHRAQESLADHIPSPFLGLDCLYTCVM